MRPALVLLLAALLAAPALALPALASHGAYVREGAIASTRTGYVASDADRYFLDLSAGERVTVVLEPLRATRGAYALGDEIVPYELGLVLEAPTAGSFEGSPGALCPQQNDPYLSGTTPKYRSAVARSAGQAVVHVKTDLVVPMGQVDYRITIAIDDHHGADRVQFAGRVSHVDANPPHCRLLA
ncbi:MAG TPA: hypothetical protein VM582_03245 [Candidatus Thermoplasmatota archaeon]|nr:hypothetical protein [Candidatus Thermoplasmatota archaeon]